MAEEARWYALQTYSGHENKVQRLIERKIDDEPGEEPEEKELQEVVVPTRDVVEIKDGERVTVTRRLYPGYVLIKLVKNQRTTYLVNNIQGVLKFVGGEQPLQEDEVNKILGTGPVEEEEEPEQEVPFRTGQVVEVTEGPFTDFSGKVQEVNADKGKAKVEVSLFGRPTSVEVDFTQLEGY